jgi:hypothetical protein
MKREPKQLQKSPDSYLQMELFRPSVLPEQKRSRATPTSSRRAVCVLK